MTATLRLRTLSKLLQQPQKIQIRTMASNTAAEFLNAVQVS